MSFRYAFYGLYPHKAHRKGPAMRGLALFAHQFRYDQKGFWRNPASVFFTVAFPEYWLYFLGLIFILVTLFLPRGVMGLLQRR